MAGSSMVFVRTCKTANKLALMLRNLGFRAVPIHGDLSQAERFEALNKTKSGDCNILVCTDVANRGLDIPSVDMVINYNTPTSFKDYVHRVGRTARAGRSGAAISLVNQYDLEYFVHVEKLVGKKIPKYTAEEEEVLLLYERVSEANRIANMQSNDSGRLKKPKCMGDDEEEEIMKYLFKGNKKKANKVGKPLKNTRPLGIKFGKAFKKSRR